MKLKGIELEGTYKVTYFSTSFAVYDERGNVIYCGYSNGYWEKGEYNEKGNRSYYENSNGYWEKWEYNEKGNVIYFENSNGEIIGERVKDGERVKELTIEEIEELLGYKIKIKGERK